MSVAVDARPRVSHGWIARYGFLYLALNVAWSTPSQLLLAIQLERLFPADKEDRLALVMLIGGLVALVVNPLAGWLSDATTGRFGRRVPWIVLGSLVAAAALVWLPGAASMTGFVLGWAVFQAGIGFAINTAQSVAPDQVPTRQYGVVSGVMGVTYTLAVVIGPLIGTLFGVGTAYLVTAAVLLVGVALFALLFRDGSHAATESTVSRESPGEDAGSTEQVARIEGYHDFWWVFVTRFLITLSQAIALFYLYYFLSDHIRYDDAEAGVLILSAVFAVSVLPAAFGSGVLSDRSGRRKPYVVVAAFGVALSTLVMAIAGSFALVVVAAVVLGLAWGAFMAIDQALINQVLPDGGRIALGMGVLNTAVALPNTLAPVVAAFALKHLGGYPGIYLLAAVLAAVGGILVRMIRQVR